jgi:hypothetical protein
MLRGRCSCAISGRPGSPSGTQTTRPTPSSFAPSSLLRPLTPLFPLDASHSPVSPLFPLHTQKQGGRGYRKDAKEVEHHHVFLTHAFTITLINIVGAPTFPFLRATGRLPKRPALSRVTPPPPVHTCRRAPRVR